MIGTHLGWPCEYTLEGPKDGKYRLTVRITGERAPPSPMRTIALGCASGLDRHRRMGFEVKWIAEDTFESVATAAEFGRSMDMDLSGEPALSMWDRLLAECILA